MPRNVQVFISHASRDKSAVLHLERTLTQWGLRPWVDRQALAGGQQWPAELQRAVANSAALVLVVTPAALASPTVRMEYQTALASAIPVFVLVLRPVPQLPAELMNAPVIDWNRAKWRGEQRLFVALYDIGIRPEEDRAVLGSQWVGNMLLANTGHAPHSWRRFTVARSRYLSLLIELTLASLLTLLPLLGVVPVVNALARPGSVFKSSLAWEMLLSASPIAVIFAAGFPFLVLTINLTAFLAYYFEWWPPEAVVIADTGVTMALFRFRWGRAGVVPAHFPFAAISRLSVRRAPFGRASLIMEGSGGPIKTALPARLRRTSALAAEIVEAWRSYTQRQPEESVGPAPAPALLTTAHSPTATPAVRLAATPLAPRYVVIAGAEDRALLAHIGRELIWRGVTPVECVELPPPESLILPTAATARAAGVALVVLSPRVAYSARLEPIVRDLASHDILVIPIVIAQRFPVPWYLGPFQWVDFSAQSDFRRSLTDLLNALDVAGVPLAAPSGVVDGELILARASHGRGLPDWRVFQTMAQMRAVYRLHEGRRVVSLWRLFTTRESAYSQLLNNHALPEMIVVTPQAAVVHVANARNSRFDDYVLPFNAIQHIERIRAYYTPFHLRVTLRDGQVVEFGVPGSLGEVDLIAAAIEQQWRAAQDQSGASLAPAPRAT